MAGTALTTITVDPNTTKIRRQGKKAITDLVVGDRVLVQAKVCKADLKDNAMPALTASKVIAHPAKAEKDEAEDDDLAGGGNVPSPSASNSHFGSRLARKTSVTPRRGIKAP